MRQHRGRVGKSKEVMHGMGHCGGGILCYTGWVRHPGGGIWHHREHRGQAGCPGGGIKCYTDFMEHTGEGITHHTG